MVLFLHVITRSYMGNTYLAYLEWDQIQSVFAYLYVVVGLWRGQIRYIGTRYTTQSMNLAKLL